MPRSAALGVIILGSDSPKNFYLQTQPQHWEVLGIRQGGHGYFIQITADAPIGAGFQELSPHTHMDSKTLLSERTLRALLKARKYQKRFPGEKSNLINCAIRLSSMVILLLFYL